MPKITNENKDIIEKNLKYIGLDLEKIPKFLKEYEPLNYRPLKSYDDTTYKVYQYVDIQDIEILITPTDRLTDLKEKYKLAAPLIAYLDTEHEENIERFATFLKLVSTMNEERIIELEEEQKKLRQQIPYEVKYENHYIWQVYYSDYTKKYFMLVPANEQDNNALFYLLKKKIENKKSRKKEYIFIPISHQEYSGSYLTKAEIADIENYLWYFTKEWASVYEVYDNKKKLSIQIVGTTNVYEKVKSIYKIEFETKEKALEFYKLLKALFILATGVTEEYNFKSRINENGELTFYFKDSEVTYQGLSDFIKEQYLEKIQVLKNTTSEKEKLEKRLKRFKNLVEELTQEYLIRQKQISTFLECKKTFFGRVKYFFKKKKEEVVLIKPQSEREKRENEQNELKEIYEEKELYTIEDLINICTKLEEKLKQNNNLNLDIHALESKKDILNKKIENADLYIQEIDNHKKSIFEFWKFTSKDEVQNLNEGEESEKEKKEKMVKFFDYETDLEDLGKIVDEVQRRKLSKNETDAIFAAKYALKSIRAIEKIRVALKEGDEVQKAKQLKVLEKELKNLQEEYEKNLEYISIKDFDIFGGLSEDKTKIKMIGNEKHREIEKDKYKVLNINFDTDLKIYMDTLENYIRLIQEAFNKIQAPYNMSVYTLNNKKSIEGIHLLDIRPEEALKPALEGKKENIILTRIDLKENTMALYYSNIIFYDNFNKTLPLGMNLSSEVLLDTNKLNLKCTKEEEFNINYKSNQFEITTKNIKVYQYELC